MPHRSSAFGRFRVSQALACRPPLRQRAPLVIPSAAERSRGISTPITAHPLRIVRRQGPAPVPAARTLAANLRRQPQTRVKGAWGSESPVAPPQENAYPARQCRARLPHEPSTYPGSLRPWGGERIVYWRSGTSFPEPNLSGEGPSPLEAHSP